MKRECATEPEMKDRANLRKSELRGCKGKKKAGWNEIERASESGGIGE